MPDQLDSEMASLNGDDDPKEDVTQIPVAPPANLSAEDVARFQAGRLLVIEQWRTAAYIQNFILNNTSKRGAAKINQSYLKARTKLLDKYWDEFSARNKLIMSQQDVLINDPYITRNAYLVVEEKYTDA
ncbi:hypothetical protein QAD02_002689 [Eretmocerus hayati]|uniref:Uncharacterized protein n=1 Tax=Eretmocerus hayati TaxID=131215 RepID=A0ACC2NPH4_9HYME|nr:hypothetical protein QAD02_002689 [Eretmocerus hayati]